MKEHKSKEPKYIGQVEITELSSYLESIRFSSDELVVGGNTYRR